MAASAAQGRVINPMAASVTSLRTVLATPAFAVQSIPRTTVRSRYPRLSASGSLLTSPVLGRHLRRGAANAAKASRAILATSSSAPARSAVALDKKQPRCGNSEPNASARKPR
jgi:hypothetical protein